MSGRVTYYDAVANLQSMFPDMELDVIKQVLASKNGHLENTVEALLMISSGEIDPNTGVKELVGAEEAMREQVKQDEVYARALQDHLFLAELRRNRDFMKQLTSEYYAHYGDPGRLPSSRHDRHHHHHQGRHGHGTRHGPASEPQRDALPEIDDDTMIDFMRKKLGSMSDGTKKKYQVLLKKWQNRKKQRGVEGGDGYRSVPQDGEVDEPTYEPADSGSDNLLYSDSLERRAHTYTVDDVEDDPWLEYGRSGNTDGTNPDYVEMRHAKDSNRKMKDN